MEKWIIGVILISIGVLLYWYAPKQLAMNYLTTSIKPETFFNPQASLQEAQNSANMITLSESLGIILAIVGFILCFRR
jgi:uncharacterized membrane protein